MQEAGNPISPAHDDEAGAGETLSTKATVDAVVAVLVLVLGAVVVYQARLLGAGWTSDGPGAGYFPFYIGLLLCVGGAGILIQSLRAKTRDEGAFVDRLQLRRVLSVFLPSVLYVGVITVLGFYLASAVFIALFMVLLGRYPPLRSVLVGVLVVGLLFAMFEVWFKVPLYKGLFNPLAFAGY